MGIVRNLYLVPKPPSLQKPKPPGAPVIPKRTDTETEPPIMHPGVPEEMRPFVMNVWKARKAKKWSQSRLDREAEIGHARTSTIEMGVKLDGITVTVVRKLAKALGVTEQWLLTGSDEKNLRPLEEHPDWFRWTGPIASQVPSVGLRLAGQIGLPENVVVTPDLVRDVAHIMLSHTGHHVDDTHAKPKAKPA